MDVPPHPYYFIYFRKAISANGMHSVASLPSTPIEQHGYTTYCANIGLAFSSIGAEGWDQESEKFTIPYYKNKNSRPCPNK